MFWFLNKENKETTEHYHRQRYHIDIQCCDLESKQIGIECEKWNYGNREGKREGKTLKNIYLIIRKKRLHKEKSWKKKNKNRSQRDSQSLGNESILIWKQYSQQSSKCDKSREGYEMIGYLIFDRELHRQ